MTDAPAPKRWGPRLVWALLVLVPLGLSAAWVADPMPSLLAAQRLPLHLTLGEPQTVEGVEVWRGGEGEGPTWVLVHGFGDSAGGWGQVIGPLARRHPLVVPNLPGHGRSAPAAPPLTFNALRRGLEAVLDTVDGRVVLVGNSLGGFLSLDYALTHPERVEQVVLVNSGGLRLDGLDEGLLIPRDREALAAKNRAVMGDKAPELPGFLADALIEHQSDPRLLSLWEDISERRIDLEGRLGQVQPHVLVVWGTGDGLLPYEGYGERFARELPSADEELLEGCSHAPQYTCAPQLVMLLERHLADTR